MPQRDNLEVRESSVSNPPTFRPEAPPLGQAASDSRIATTMSRPGQTAQNMVDRQFGTPEISGMGQNRSTPGQFSDAVSGLKGLYNVDGKNFDREQAGQIFNKAAADWREKNPNTSATHFANQFNSEITKAIPQTMLNGRYQTNHLFASGDSNGNLTLNERRFPNPANPNDKSQASTTTVGRTNIGDTLAR